MNDKALTKETIEICVTYFVNKGLIPFNDKWKHIDRISESFSGVKE